jgi:hypothetical protein
MTVLVNRFIEASQRTERMEGMMMAETMMTHQEVDTSVM